MAGKRRERMAAFHRGNILESARLTFQKKGIAGTTMDDIAKAAEYRKTTIYNYFRSKEELVNHLFFEGIEFFNNKLSEEAAQASSFADFYERLCALIIKIHDNHPIYYEGISAPGSNGEDVPATDILRKISFAWEGVSKTIEGEITKAQESKEIALGSNIQSTMLVVWLSMMGIIEKSVVKEDYITFKTGQSRTEFLNFAFKTLFQLLEMKAPQK